MDKESDTTRKIFARRPEESAYSSLLASHNRFALKLFKEIAQQETGRNVVVSPVSIAIALATAYNGAVGGTAEAIAHVLELVAVSPDTINSACAALLMELDQLDPQLALTMTNKIEVGKNMAIKSAFLQTITKYFKVEVSNMGDLDGIRLTNLMTFKGTWTEAFDLRMTHEHPFTLLNGDRKPCSMMSSPTQDWAYHQHDRFQFVKLPYGKRRVSMYILLPGKNDSLSELLVKRLTPENWDSWVVKLVEMQGTVELPRFEVDYSVELKSVLSMLGMEIAFDPNRANFDAICPSPVFIDWVGHRAQIEVDEEGTEASAETLIEITLGAGAPDKVEFRMVVDRPFFYVIRDDRTGLFLFVGQLVDPAPQVSTTWDERQQESLRDALDLMAIRMKSGLSFEVAMASVYEEWNHELAQNFGRVLREMQLGRSRHDALKDMTKRVNMPDVSEFVNAVIEAEQANGELLEVVRAHAQRLRKKSHIQ